MSSGRLRRSSIEDQVWKVIVTNQMPPEFLPAPENAAGNKAFDRRFREICGTLEGRLASNIWLVPSRGVIALL